MKIIFILLGVITSQLSLAETRLQPRIPTQAELKPEPARPVDLIERVQVCGNGRCQQVPVREIIRQIQEDRARGGDIIGNGGGLGEMNFVYALSNLADFITDTVKNENMNGRDADNLLKIAALSRREARKKDKLIFISAQKNPEIFSTHAHEEARLAVTGSSATAPIFVNLDMLYKKIFDMTEVMALPEMISILVHELGHQVGIEDHAYLDYLGARVRRMVSRDINRISRPLGEKTKFEFLSFSYWSQNFPKLQLAIEGNLKDFSADLAPLMKCSDGKRPVSMRMSNQHLAAPVGFNGNWVVPFRAWIELACFSNGNVIIEHKTLVLDTVISEEENYSVRVIQTDLRDE